MSISIPDAKLHATTLLRAMGYSTDEEILELFYDVTTATLAGKKAMEVVGSYAGRKRSWTPIPAKWSFKAGEMLTEAHLDKLGEAKVKKLKIIEIDEHREAYVIINTLAKDVDQSIAKKP